MFGKKNKDNKPVNDQIEMFPTIGDPTERAPADAEHGDEFLPGYKTKDEALSAINKINELERRLAEFASANDDRDLPRAKPTEAPKQAEFDFTSLPDPVEDREGYARAMLEQATRIVESKATERFSAVDRESRAQDLEAEFYDNYPDLADYTEVVEAATKAELAHAQRRGVDVDSYVFQHSDRFMKKVADRANKRLEELRSKWGVEDEDETPGKPPRRTGGVSSGTRSAPRASADAPPATSFVDDLKKEQRRLGFF